MFEVGLFTPGSKGKRGRLFQNCGGWYEDPPACLLQSLRFLEARNQRGNDL